MIYGRRNRSPDKKSFDRYFGGTGVINGRRNRSPRKKYWYLIRHFFEADVFYGRRNRSPDRKSCDERFFRDRRNLRAS